MTKSWTSYAVPFMALAALCLGTARADVQTLVEAGKISWSGSSEEIKILGGSVVTSGDYDELVLKFTDTAAAGSLVISSGVKASVRTLVVGGGGAGGTSTTSTSVGAGGGGGAGGFIDQTQTLEADNYTITVGAGGAAATSTDTAVGNNGNDSSFVGTSVSVVAKGGGGGGAQSVGNAGGSGGGGSYGSAACNGGSGTTDQGNGGGKGNNKKYGGGGGGAGGAGSVTSSFPGPGAGGVGKTSDIVLDESGDPIYYAGGGGGGSMGAYASSRGLGGGGIGGTSSSSANAGEDGTGGGGGGSGSTAPGGKGGNGVVILRIRDLLISVPADVSLEWNGENQVGYEPKNYYEFVGGTTNATASGAYYYQIKPAGDFEWADGEWTTSSTETKTIEWTIAKMSVEIPSTISITYDGLSHQVASSDDIHQIVSGTATATNVGEYSFTLHLLDTDNTVWSDNTTSDKTAVWRIVVKEVSKPSVSSDLVYSGTNSVAFSASDGIVYVSGTTNSLNAGSFEYVVALDNPAGYTNYVWAGETGADRVSSKTVSWSIAAKTVTEPVAQEGLVYNGTAQDGFAALDWTLYELVSGTTNETAGGTYEATFHLKANDSADNYVWSSSSSPADYTVSWSIAAAENEITDLSLAGWRIGKTANTPSITATWGASTVEYSYGFGESVDSVTSWVTDTDEITTPGTWVLRAIIPQTSSWSAATNVTLFSMWSDPEDVYRDWTEITIKARSGATETLTNFPVLVRISETRMPGFTYKREGGHSGEQMAFIDADDNQIPYEVDTWDTTGESLVWVKLLTLPPAGTTIKMYWNLNDGQPAIEYTPQDVWTDDYLGIWHMNTNGVNTIADTKGVSDGTFKGSANVADGCLGSGLSLPSAGSYVTCGSTISNSTLASGFTIEGWVNSSNLSGRHYLFGKNNMMAIRTENANKIYVTSPNVKDYNFTYTLPTRGTWYHYALTYVQESNGLKFYLNGSRINMQTVSAAFKDASSMTEMWIGASQLNTASHNFLGVLDEYRLSKTIRSAEWLKAEYLSASDNGFTTNSVVHNDGLLVDFWVEEPAIDKAIWDINDTPGSFTSTGKLRYGVATNYIYSVYNPSEIYNSISEITAAGTYRAVFTQVDSTGYQPIEKLIEIRVLTSKPYTKIGGANGDSGRVLLMNRDRNANCPIENQGYDTKSATSSTFWELVNTDGDGLMFNLQAGTESILWTKGYGAKLWHLIDCRHGNSYPQGATTLDSLDNVQNYLPFSSTSYSIFASIFTKAKPYTAGQIVMRNTTGAVVYSPCYTNGIGTIYFDAVNAWAEDTENYNLVVEYATNTVANLPPTDLNSYSIETNYVEDVPVVSTNWYGNIEGCWNAATMRPFVCDGTDDFVETNSTTELSLRVTTGGTAANFYRVVVPIDYAGPIRFRIRRTTNDTSWGVDVRGFILLDNIIASVPAMGAGLTTPGHYDELLTGNLQHGWDLATSVPYPSISDGSVTGRALPFYFVNADRYDGTAVDTNDFISAATMHYRWRYLGQKFSEWQTVDLDPLNDFKAVNPISIPEFTCDFEYWYETRQQAPYYQYVDYSGLGKSIGYTEARSVATNALNSASLLESTGTNWFFRVRDGKSDYRTLDIVYSRDSNTFERVNMMLVSDHIWRGFLQTRTNDVGVILYRIEGLDKQTEEFATYSPSTNRWYCTTDSATLPVSDKLTAGDEDSWSSLTLDATSGYVMFQIDDSTESSGLGLTIVHADYQNFNIWSDARGTTFVGSSTEDSAKSGTSPLKQTFTQDFDTWKPMPVGNSYWEFASFTDIKHLLGRTAYESFAADSDGAWGAGPGMWVSKKYKIDKDNSGVALQMEGCGKGYLQLNDTDFAPRGVESVTMNARLGQFIEFDDFNYYFGGSFTSMSNYTFMTRVAFDLNSNKNFDGNASLSLVADFLPHKGCYEARWEWIKDMTSSKGGQRLCLYRWNVSAGKRTDTLLAAWTNNSTFAQASVTSLSSGSKFTPFYITVSNDTKNACTFVAAGVRSSTMTLGAGMSSSAGGWYTVGYRDKSDARLTRGTFGVLSANCEGVFGNPEFSETPVMNEELTLKDNKGGVFSNKSRAFPGLSLRTDGFETGDAEWNIQPGRMKTAYVSAAVTAIQADPAAQDLSIYLGTAGKADWGSPVTNISVSSFGGKKISLPIYSKTASAIRFASGASFDDARTDLVLDSVSVRQFRGDDYSNGDDMVNYIPNWVDPYSVSPGTGMTNWVFTSAWITNTVTGTTTNGMLLLSARRTRSGDVSSIRSPLMDHYAYSDGSRRGIGLGMVSFDYLDAQSNAVILVQIATNGVKSSTLANWDTNAEGLWETVDTFDFSTLSATERKKGTLSTYVGLHGVTGIMRIVVDPALVVAVSNETDTAAFGEVKISKVVCRDEPELDSSCWWGWNLRTVGATSGADTEKKMYLPDLASDSEEVGMSLALNNSTTADVVAEDKALYKQHIPFVQTPTFKSAVVGEISFKARKYDPDVYQPASVTLYGSTTGSEDSEWTAITNFVVKGDLYQTYSYRTDPGSSYAAFRLGVSGVPGVSNAGSVVPSVYSEPVRVMIEEVFVSEAVRARMAFKNVGAFRSNLSGTDYVANVPSKGEQPLCNEGWGVQCEIFATQLAKEIDTSRAPEVYLHWFEGTEPWGFENWKNESGHHAGQLARATDTNMIYRSSFVTAPDAIVQMSTTPGSVVQYMLEVRYYQLGTDVMSTNYLASTDWTRPDWYRPLDLNADLGGGTDAGFSAYNILDTVAPGWAWINEVNIHGVYDDDWKNSEADAQFVEIAVPMESDISGWKIRFLGGNLYSEGTVPTNTIAEFGTSELPGMKKGNLGAASNMVFRVIGSPKALAAGTLKESDGTLDGVWNFENITDTFLSGGELFSTDPFGIQLVRASGIVEHEIVCIGTNFYGSIPGMEKYYSPTNTVEYFKRNLRECGMFYAGADEAGAKPTSEWRSLGVFQSSGETSNQWNNVMKRTPGRINEDQQIDPDHPTPNGETIVVYCMLDTSVGHVYQTVGEAVATNASQTIFIRRGSDRGTNIVYSVDPWYQLDSVTTNGASVSFSSTGLRTYEVTVGVGVSNSFTVVASAKVEDKLVNEFGLTEDNRYTPAVLDWLSGGVDLYGNPWSDPTSGTIKLADFINANDVVLTNLNLTQMYWLDMDPTVGDLALKGYISKAPSMHYVTGDGGQSMTNLRMDVFMQITNRASNAAWRPYALRGLVPGSSSLAYTNSSFRTSWTSETFKAVGFIDNGHTGIRVRDNWVPLRWFVFVPDSFRAPGSANAFTSTIEVKDPFSTESPAYTAGWYKWAKEHGKPQDYYFWCLDDRIQPISVEVLRQESTYDD